MSDWIYGIVAVMLFGTVILQVTPEGAYQKYVRLFLGALLIMTVIGPLYSWLGLAEGSRLSFEQRILSSWRMTALERTGMDNMWQESDHWERRMQEQVSQKQETWMQDALKVIAEGYGFKYIKHEVRWDLAGNWPDSLVLWVEKSGEENGYNPEDIAGNITKDIADHPMEIEGVSSVEPIVFVTDRYSDKKREGQDKVYYEPSELRPLHQALQVVWQLEEGQIVLYLQR